MLLGTHCVLSPMPTIYRGCETQPKRTKYNEILMRYTPSTGSRGRVCLPGHPKCFLIYLLSPPRGCIHPWEAGSRSFEHSQGCLYCQACGSPRWVLRGAGLPGQRWFCFEEGPGSHWRRCFWWGKCGVFRVAVRPSWTWKEHSGEW